MYFYSSEHFRCYVSYFQPLREEALAILVLFLEESLYRSLPLAQRIVRSDPFKNEAVARNAYGIVVDSRSIQVQFHLEVVHEIPWLDFQQTCASKALHTRDC